MRKFLVLILWVLPTSAQAGISIVQSSGTNINTVTSATCILPNAVGAGDLIILDTRWGAQTGTLSATDTAGNTLTISSGPVSDTIAGGNEIIQFYGINTNAVNSDTITLSVSGGGSHRITQGCFDYSSTTGWAASPFDAKNGSFSANTANTADPGSVTPSVTGELIHGTLNCTQGTCATFTAAGGCTIQNANGGANGFAGGNRATAEDLQGAGTGATDCTFGWAATEQGWSAVVATFKVGTGAAASSAGSKIKKLMKFGEL